MSYKMRCLWLLPSLGLRATVFHFNPVHELDQAYDLDVGRNKPPEWSSSAERASGVIHVTG
jgi:uncharacterized protein